MQADDSLLALSHPEAELTESLWDRALALDAEIERRAAEHEVQRREGQLGAPDANGHSYANGHSQQNGH